jgi:hypothetical protein
VTLPISVMSGAPYLCWDRMATVRMACGAWLLLVGGQQASGR